MTKFLNLDEISGDAGVVIQLNGKKHELQVTTVEGWIANLKAIEKLGLNPSPVEEMEVTVEMIHRAFPTMSVEEIRQLNMNQLRDLAQFARAASGEIVEVEKEDDKGNGSARS